MTWNDREYYRCRAREEEAAAGRATCPVARERHLELAELYGLRSQDDWTPGRPDVVVMPLWVARPKPDVPLAMAG